MDQGLAGTVNWADGSKQVTLSGWPLYRYADDSKACDFNGQGSVPRGQEGAGGRDQARTAADSGGYLVATLLVAVASTAMLASSASASE